MSWVLANWEQTQRALVGREFVFTLPDIVLANGGYPQSVENAPPGSQSGTAWDISLAGAPTTMGIATSRPASGHPKFISVAFGRLSQLSLWWTPTAQDCYIVEDGRQKRPRFWIVVVQVTGRGRWEGRQWDLSITIEATDRVLHSEIVRDADSIATHGLGWEYPLPWYKHDQLALALKRRYLRPPLVSEWTLPNHQPSAEHVRVVDSLDVGDLVRLEPNGLEGLRPHTAMIVEVKWQFPPGGRGLGYKQIVTVERIIESIPLEINGIPLSINGIPLEIGG